MKLLLNPANPGEFFACCGLFELCGLRFPDSVANFKLKENNIAEFEILPHVSLQKCVQVLREARVKSYTHSNSGIDPVSINTEWGEIFLNWWFNQPFIGINEKNVNKDLKTWSGHVRPAVMIKNAIELLKQIEADRIFNEWKPLQKGKTARFGLDALSNWTTRDYGFSPDAANLGFAIRPGIELLGTIGLQTFRPRKARNGFEYSIWEWSLPLPIARVACGIDPRKTTIKLGIIATFYTEPLKRGATKGFKIARIII